MCLDEVSSPWHLLVCESIQFSLSDKARSGVVPQWVGDVTQDYLSDVLQDKVKIQWRVSLAHMLDPS
jgi:hypothetical protein